MLNLGCRMHAKSRLFALGTTHLGHREENGRLWDLKNSHHRQKNQKGAVSCPKSHSKARTKPTVQASC